MKTINISHPRTEILSYNDFKLIPPVTVQRNESMRLNKLKKRIRGSTLPTIAIVHVAEYPSGRRELLDGNTRKALWNQANPGFAPPKELFALVYPVQNESEATELYYSFDNAGAAETGSEKITGYYRQLGLHGKFATPKIARGIIGRSLEEAGRNNPECGPMLKTVSYFQDELLILDAWNLSNLKAPIWAAAFMLAKTHGANKRLREALENLNLGCQLGQKDRNGQEPGLKRLHDAFLGVGPDEDMGLKSKGNNNNLTQQTAFALYCIEAHLSGQTFKNRLRETTYMNNYDNYWAHLWDDGVDTDDAVESEEETA